MGMINPTARPTLITLIGATATAVALWLAAGWHRIRVQGARGRVFDADGTHSAPRRVTLGLFAALFLASYLLISNTVVLIGVSLAERLFYWPSVPVLIGVATATVLAVRALAPSRLRLLAVVVGLLVGLLAVRSAARGLDWRDSRSLFEGDAARHPQSVVLNHWVAQVLTFQASALPQGAERDQLLDRAQAALDGVLAAAPNLRTAMQQQGLIYELRGDTQRAIEYFERTLQLWPDASLPRAHLDKLMETVR
jgi:tetratricopeptide (TPR) repeat protein